MRRFWPTLLIFTLACSLFTPGRTPTPPATKAPTATFTPVPPPATATLAPTETAAPTATPVPTEAREFYLRPSDVTFHPVPDLYSGDVVSVEVRSENADPDWEHAWVKLYAGSRLSEPIAKNRFGQFGIGRRAQATFVWVWDTAGLTGPQTLLVTVEAEEDSAPEVAPLDVLTLTVNLLPAALRPMPEPLADWARVESVCCIFHYLTGTAAARDIELITATADEAFEKVEAVLGVRRDRKVSFTLLSRLLGHGGFASEEISLTYIDRNAAGSSLATVFVHEGTHILDRRLGDLRPTLMIEGLAVYVAGGHFKPEDLDRRAAALLPLDRYIPLRELANNFYPSQHEIGYLEAGALVKYLVDTYGWEKFSRFYGSFEKAESDARMLDAAMRKVYNRGLDEIEADWLSFLKGLPPDAGQQADLRLTVVLYDTLRRYQAAADPSAHFLTAWLPNGPEGRRRGIIADFVRHPAAPENIALEAMLGEAARALEAGEFDTTERLLNSVNAVLDAGGILLADPLATVYLDIVTDLAREGYEAQTISVAGDSARVQAIRDWPALEGLTLTHTSAGWTATAGRLDPWHALSRSIIFGRP